MRSTSAACVAATGTSPDDRAIKPSTTMSMALILFPDDGGSGGRRALQNFAAVLGNGSLYKALRARGEAGPDRAARGRNGGRSASRPAGSRRRGRIDDSHAARRHAGGPGLYHDG